MNKEKADLRRMFPAQFSLIGKRLTGPEEDPTTEYFSGMGQFYYNFEPNMWFSGKVISTVFGQAPNVSHIEGYAAKDEVRFLEMPQQNPPYSRGDYADFRLEFADYPAGGILDLEGSVKIHYNHEMKNNQDNLVRARFEFPLQDHEFDTEYGGCSIIPTILIGRTAPEQRPLIPEFWNTFLAEVEQAGLEHPYGKVTPEAQERERRGRKSFFEELDAEAQTNAPIRNDDDIPF